GQTGMPAVPAILERLLAAALERAGLAGSPADPAWSAAVADASWKLGFEVTLNDLLQHRPDTLLEVYGALADLEKRCRPNNVHRFLNRWVRTGGTVITVNYDRLLELADDDGRWPGRVRFREKGRTSSLAAW